MKKIVTAAWRGISISTFVFLLICIVIGLCNGETKFASGFGMARMGAASLLIGLGFGIPTLVYETELETGIKIFIHMGTGCLVMIGASVLAGWIRPEYGAWGAVLFLAAEIVVSFAIFGICLLRERALAKRMNERIAEKKPEA